MAGTLLGRQDLTRRLGDLLDGVPRHGRMVALTGEPGVGKSAIQAATVDEARARGFRVLAARGSESETHLPFASLHQVLRPILGNAAHLPARQREALLSGFGMSDVAVPDRFLVSLAVLEMLAEQAQEAPVLVSLEDLQWMDEPTLDVVSFLARRIEAEPIMLLASLRAGTSPIVDDPSIEWVPVAGLDGPAAAALLAETAPGLDGALRDRVLRQAAGNPLALLEFPVAMASGRFGWTELSDELPMTTRLERAFVSRAEHLPAGARTVLAVAALEDGTDLAEILAAAAVLAGEPLGPEVVGPALEAGLLVSDGTAAEFGHPLVRSALRHSMPAAERHRTHAALAQVLDDRHHDRAVWHRAAAAGAPDERVAADLEAAAEGAVRRGALASAVTWLQRAASLSPSADARGARLLRAAEVAFELGRADQVDQLRQQLDRAALAPRDASRLTWLEGAFDDGASADPAQVGRLVVLAREALQARDADLAFQLLIGAGRRAWWGEPGEPLRHEIVVAARAASLPDGDPRVLAVLALAESNEHAPAVARLLQGWSADADGQPEVAALLAIAAFCVGDLQRAMTLLAAPVDALRSQGRLSTLAEALAIRSWAAMYQGDFELVSSADEAMRLADQTGRSLWGAAARIALATLGVLRGTSGAADAALLAEAERVALRPTVPMSTLLAAVQLARGLADIGAGRHDDAYQQLRRVFEPGDPSHHRVQQIWALGYLVDAAIPSGHREEAGAVLAEMERLAGPDAPPAAAIALQYARAVLADDAAADELFRMALDGASRTSRWHRARVELAYGAWLRRHRRVVESRAMLRQARDAFEALGTRDWAERADQELRASGEQGRPSARPTEALSPQESEIARLAATGLSNREIAQRLYLSHRTVGSHLYRIFPKLGVTSRAQLGRVLAAD
jgi:DNA-binding CsgD family transcriptional regulator/tetratricopeptide (TPR) repeat protein